MAKKPARGGARVSPPRPIRVIPSSQPANPVPVPPVFAAGGNDLEAALRRKEAEAKEIERKNGIVGAPPTPEIKYENDIAQIPIAELTLDVPLIPFIPNKRKVVPPPFHFLQLPSELRVKIYEYYFEDVDPILDLDPTNYKRYHKMLGLMRVCRQVHSEATWIFYSTHSFRVFPVHHAKLKTKKPILARLKPRQRECLQTLDVRLGPGWNSPPRSWVINDALGLKDCTSATKLNVFVECDPSHGIFKGFRRSEGFYEGFSRELLAGVIAEMPALRVVEFDAWSLVKKNGPMMRGLIEVVRDAKLDIRWGPERGWTDQTDEEDAAVAEAAALLDATTLDDSNHAPANIMVAV